MKNNQIVIGDTVYEINAAYIAGALKARAEVPYLGSPYTSGSQSDADWDFGHGNEGCNEHIRFGEDVITAKRNGRVFEEDPSIKRNEHGEVILEKVA